MPDLPLTPAHLSAEMALTTIGIIEACMLAPRDMENRARFVAASGNAALRQQIREAATAGASVPARAVVSVLDAPADDRDLTSLAKSAHRRGVAAGQMLLSALVAARGGALRFGPIKERIGGIPGLLTGASPSSIENEVWGTFRSVAALFAAHLSEANELALAIGADSAPMPCRRDRIAIFLAKAEALRAEAETIRPYRGSAPLLSPDESWRVPEDVRRLLPALKLEPMTRLEKARLLLRRMRDRTIDSSNPVHPKN